MSRRRVTATRRHRWLAVSAAGSALMAAALFSIHAYATATIRSKASAALSSRLDRAVTIDDVDLGWGSLALRGITVARANGDVPTARIERIVATYDVTDLLDKHLTVGRIDVYGVSLEVTRDGDGQLDIDDVIAHLGRSAVRATGGDGFSLSIDKAPIELHDVTVRGADVATGTAIELRADHVTPTGRRSIKLTGGALTGSSQTPAIAALLDNKPLTDVSGSLALRGGDAVVDLSGAFIGAEAERWSARGTVSPGSRSAELSIETDSVRLDRIARIASAHLGSSIVDRAETTITSRITASISDDVVVLAGEVAVRNLNVAHRRLATRPLRDVTFKLSGSVELDRRARRISMTDGSLESGAVTYEITGAAQLADAGRADHPQARLAFQLAMPTVRCQDMLASFPRTMLPELDGFELDGELAGHVSLAIDWANLKKTELHGDLGLAGCRVRSAPERMSADRLRGSFEHRVPVGDRWITYTVGPENADYVPLDQVSRNLTRSLLTTEDSRFYRHDGFIAKQFRTALIKNLEAGYFRYGASSITMQVVKNVMLSREKTISRKLEELFLTWYLEKELTKDRILEIYVNAIEFGPSIYGIKPAARQYFNKHPRRLNPVESAFFSSILPAPNRRFKQYCRGWAGNWTNGKIDRILDIMVERNRLDEEQYFNALTTPLVFRGSRAEICKRYENQQEPVPARGRKR